MNVTRIHKPQTTTARPTCGRDAGEELVFVLAIWLFMRSPVDSWNCAQERDAQRHDRDLENGRQITVFDERHRPGQWNATR